MTKVLIVEDDVAFALMLRTWLSKNGYEAESVVSAEQAVKRMGECVFDVVLSDLRLPDRDGITLLEWIRHKSPHSEVIIMTGYANVSTAVAAIKLGAFDYLEKPVNPEILREKMTAAVTRHEQRRSRPETQSASEPGTAIVWGHSEASAKLRDHLLLVAPTNMSVLITGESGTGKELIAEAIHQNSKRSKSPFVKVNLGGISQSLFESEMFGHKKGAFTDAFYDRTGRFETADKGSIFLDEIGELDMVSQVKLLRVLQDQTFEPLGDSRQKQVDTRIISATNRNLQEMVRDGSFREDLFYRINLITIRMPALRERPDDIPLLVDHFVGLQRELNGIRAVEVSAEAIDYLQKLPYPGNIRELKNLVDRTILVSDKNVLTDRDFKAQYSEISSATAAFDSVHSLEEIEKNMIRKAAEQFGNNHTKIATALGLSRQALYRRLEKYGIRLPE